MRESRRLFPMVVPSATVFFSSACIMVLEIVAGRLIARFLGSSLYTWTSVIGVVLAGIAIGNYVGGRLADRFAPGKALAVMFTLASVSCVVIVMLNNTVGEWIWLWKLSWPVRVFTHVSLVFLLPSTLLGTISPVVAKMALDQGLATGRTVGSIYAWGAAGSIAGTFLAGFVLIAAFGTIAIIWTIAGAMLLMAVLYWARFWALYGWAAMFIVLLTMGTAPFDWAEKAGSTVGLRQPHDPRVLYEAETPYCYVAVRRVSDQPDTRAFMQDKLKHSEIVIGDVTRLQYFYTKIYAGLTHVLAKDQQAPSMMVIGGGGYAFPQYLKHHWPDAEVEVVEIDPGVTEAAMQAFGLPRDTTIRTISMDARNYVDQLIEQERTGGAVKRYDFIYEDAINDYSVPYQLVTKEFNDKIAQMLADDGVYLVNLIDMYKEARFLGAVYGTLTETFAHVHVITDLASLSLPMLRDTYVVVASKQPFDPKAVFAEYDENLKLRIFGESQLRHITDRAGGVIITDDYAPVENMLAPVVRQSAREILAARYLSDAQLLQGRNQWDQSIAKYEQAVALNPSMSIKAYNEIGLMRVAQSRPDEAAEAFRAAIDYHNEVGTGESVIASLYLNLGLLYQRMNRIQDSMKPLAEAAKWFRIEARDHPQTVAVWDRLGDTLASMGDMAGASDAFAKAVELEPQNPAHYQKLAKSLEFQQRYDEAIDVIRKQIALMKRYGQDQAAAELAKYVEFLQFQKTKQSRPKQ